jgi:hypothetical protein
MKTLEARNDLFGDGAATRATIADDGYILFKGVIDADLIDHAKHGVMAWLESQGVVTVVGDEPVWTGTDASAIGEYPPGLYATGILEWLLLRPEASAVLERALGEPVRILPMGEYQYTWPGKPNCWVRAHQDGPYTAGLDFYVIWIPLMAIDETLGGLALVPTPQACGSLHPDADPGSTSTLLPFIPPETFSADEWCRADYEPGDLLIFGPWTPHCGMPNSSDRLRLSLDTRVQPRSFTPPITGVVIAEEAGRVTIADDHGVDRTVFVDGETSVPLLSRSGLLGRRVLATADVQGRALLVRNQRGFIPVT